MNRLTLRTLVLASFLAPALLLTPLHAQTTRLDKQLARIDLGLSGAGVFNRSVTGPIVSTGGSNTGANVTDAPSSTVGLLVDIRYIVRPFVGAEFNYSYARFTQNYSTAPGGVQAQANEYSLGYVATPAHPVFGFQPFVSVGAGVMEFKPTPRGGQGLLKQARADYYYSAGLQQDYFSHVGFRAAFRQAFFLAPDFGQNYLTIKKHTSSIEPTIGVYFRF